jgi:hypothetical protein
VFILSVVRWRGLSNCLLTSVCPSSRQGFSRSLILLKFWTPRVMMTLLILGTHVLDLWICKMLHLSLFLELRLTLMVPQIA